MTAAEWIWLFAVVAFIVLEAATYQMVCIWFIGGSIAGMIACLFGADFWVQMTAFLAVSVLLIIAFRPLVIKRLNNRKVKTNIDSLIGKKIVITETVDNIKSTGQCKIDGVVWLVRSINDTIIPEGDVAEIKRIEGVRLIAE